MAPMNSHNEMLLSGKGPELPMFSVHSQLLNRNSQLTWHTSCTKTASMWNQGWMQFDRCPNPVHVPRHSLALRVSVSFLPQGGFREISRNSGIIFFFGPQTIRIPQCLSPPIQITILKPLERCCEGFLKGFCDLQELDYELFAKIESF
jgi:hypothetical protein